MKFNVSNLVLQNQHGEVLNTWKSGHRAYLKFQMQFGEIVFIRLLDIVPEIRYLYGVGGGAVRIVCVVGLCFGRFLDWKQYLCRDMFNVIDIIFEKVSVTLQENIALRGKWK